MSSGVSRKSGITVREQSEEAKTSNNKRFLHPFDFAQGRLSVGMTKPCLLGLKANKSYSSCAFGNLCNTGSCRVGSRYFKTRRKIGLKNGLVCMT